MLLILVDLGLGLLFLDLHLLVGSDLLEGRGSFGVVFLEFEGEHVFEKEESHQKEMVSPGIRGDLLQLGIEGGIVIVVLEQVLHFLLLDDCLFVLPLVLLPDLVTQPLERVPSLPSNALA